MGIFGNNNRKREQLLAQQRYQQSQDAYFGNEGFQKAAPAINPLDVKGAAAGQAKPMPDPQPANFSNEASYVNIRQAKKGAAAKVRTVISVILTIIAIIGIVLSAVRFGMYFKNYLACGKTVEGVCVEYVSLAGIAPNKKAPIIEFEAGDGKIYRHTALCEVGTYPYREGVEVMMKYNKVDPNISTFEVELHSSIAKLVVSVGICLVVIVLAWLIKPRVSRE